MIPIQFEKQILPGTFEYSLHYLIDNEIDLSIFDLRYRNDETQDFFLESWVERFCQKV